MRLLDLTSMIDRLAADSAGRLQTADRADALVAALERYSQDRPRRAVADLAVSGNGIDLPDGWEAGFSAALNIEHPIGQRPPANLPNEGWYFYQTPTAERIMLADGYGASGLARLTYTLRHVADANADTCSVASQHLEAVASWAAAVLCEQLATYYAGNSDSTIQADTVDHTSPARQYASRAKDLRKRYFDELGVDTKRTAAAGAVASPVPKNSLGLVRLTHPLRPWRWGA